MTSYIDPDRYVFMIVFQEAYNFRYCMALANAEVSEVVMKLMKDRILIEFVNEGQKVGYKQEFFTDCISDYVYNARNEDGTLKDFYTVSFPTDEMHLASKVERKDGLRIYQLKEQTYINIEHIKGSSASKQCGGSEFVTITNRNYSPLEVNETEYKYPSHPNVTIQAKEFSVFCSRVQNRKARRVRIEGRNDKMIIDAIDASEVIKFNQYYDCTPVYRLNSPESETYQNTVYSISADTIKALAKINNISSNGAMLKIYYAYGLPLKIETTISTFGKFEIYALPNLEELED